MQLSAAAGERAARLLAAARREGAALTPRRYAADFGSCGARSAARTATLGTLTAIQPLPPPDTEIRGVVLGCEIVCRTAPTDGA